MFFTFSFQSYFSTLVMCCSFGGSASAYKISTYPSVLNLLLCISGLNMKIQVPYIWFMYMKIESHTQHSWIYIHISIFTLMHIVYLKAGMTKSSEKDEMI